MFIMNVATMPGHGCTEQEEDKTLKKKEIFNIFKAFIIPLIRDHPMPQIPKVWSKAKDAPASSTPSHVQNPVKSKPSAQTVNLLTKRCKIYPKEILSNPFTRFPRYNHQKPQGHSNHPAPTQKAFTKTLKTPKPIKSPKPSPTTPPQ